MNQKIYTPDIVAERQVLRGLIQHIDFLKLFIERQVKPLVFESEDADSFRKIAEMVVDYYRSYATPMKVSQILAAVSAEVDERKDEEAELKLVKIRRVLQDVLSVELRPTELPYLLDNLIEKYKSYCILRNAKELERFYGCRFEHQKHEACKDCPVWSLCKGMVLSERTFSDKLVSAQGALSNRLLEVTGTAEIRRGSASEEMQKAKDRYLERERKRKEGGANFVFGVPTPWPTVTKRTDGWQPEQVYGLMAERKTGKTTCFLMISNAAVLAGRSVRNFIMEDTPERWMDKFFCQAACLDWEDFRLGQLAPHEVERMHTTMEHYQKAWDEGSIGDIKFFHRPIEQMTLEDVEGELIRCNNEGERVDLVTLDHMHAMKMPWGPDTRRDDLRVNKIPVTFKRFAQQFKVPFVFAGQLKASGDRKGKARGSDQIEDSLDVAMQLVERKGVFILETTYARQFAPFSIELENQRHRILLPEDTSNRSSLEEELNIPTTEWLG